MACSGEEVAGGSREKAFIIKMWKDGFSIDDKDIRLYSDPSNKEFLQSVMKGSIPPELVKEAKGCEVNVDMEDHRQEDFVKPKTIRKASGGKAAADDCSASSSPSNESNLVEEGPVGSIDLTNVAEYDLSSFVNHTVQDSKFSPNTTNRAKKSLPKKLALKRTNAKRNSADMGVWVQKHIPKGTRFGPIVGEIKAVKDVTEEKFLWKMSDIDEDFSEYICAIDVGDVLKSNWMRYVQLAESQEGQNLVAYQDRGQIFFLAIRDIQKEEELAVWYCKEFGVRAGRPESPSEWRECLEVIAKHLKNKTKNTNVEISIEITDKISDDEIEILDKQSGEGIKISLDNSEKSDKQLDDWFDTVESDSGYTGSPICDNNESDENSCSDSKQESSETLIGANGTKVIHLECDLDVEITPGSKYIMFKGKSFYQNIFYCLYCKSGTGLFMGEENIVNHFHIYCKACRITIHGFEDIAIHMMVTHKTFTNGQLQELREEWKEDYIEEISSDGLDIKESEVRTKGLDVDTKASDEDTAEADLSKGETRKQFNQKSTDKLPKKKASDIINADETSKKYKPGRKRVKKLVDKTFIDDKGYMVTKKVFESGSETDNEPFPDKNPAKPVPKESSLDPAAADEDIEDFEGMVPVHPAAIFNMKLKLEKLGVTVKSSCPVCDVLVEGDINDHLEVCLHGDLLVQENLELPPAGVATTQGNQMMTSVLTERDNSACTLNIEKEAKVKLEGEKSACKFVREKETKENVEMDNFESEIIIEKETKDQHIELIENINLCDSEPTKSSPVLKNIDCHEVERSCDEEIKIKSDLIMHTTKMISYRQNIDNLQQNHRLKDNMIKDKIDELKKCCYLSPSDCQSIQTVYEQEIEALQKSGMEKDALFNKLDSIQTEGAAANATSMNLFEKEEVKTNDETGHTGPINEVRKERKRDKMTKPYCTRSSCPNRGRHRCSRCKAVFYCHEQCLVEDWSHHKTFCDYVFKANRPPQDGAKKEPEEAEEGGTIEEVD